MLVLGSTILACKQISLGGTTVSQSIDLELDQSATQQISMNDNAVRTLMGVSSGQISLSNGWGKGKARTLTTYTFPAGYTTWTAPCTTDKILTAVGVGGVANRGYWYTGISSNFYSSVYKYPTTASGITGSQGSLDWSTPYNSIVTDINGINALGTGIRQIGRTTTYIPYRKTWYMWTNNGINSTSFSQFTTTAASTSGYCRGTLSIRNSSNLPTSGQVLWSAIPSNYGNYFYPLGDFYTIGTRNDTYISGTGLYQVFLGGDFIDDPTSGLDGTVGAAPSSTQSFTNLTVTPGQQYTIYNAGSLTITYYV